jgi:hypothetical protein
MLNSSSTVSGELLTSTEIRAVQLLGDFAGLMRQITGEGPDWTEAAQRIHALQHMVMAQAAARAYPDLYRALGEEK